MQGEFEKKMQGEFEKMQRGANCNIAKSGHSLSLLEELTFASKKGASPHINNFELGQHGRYRRSSVGLRKTRPFL